MEPVSQAPQSPLRRIVIDNVAFGSGNMEAWGNVIRSYEAAHPGHRVLLVYQGKLVQGLSFLFKLGKSVDRDGFEVAVSAQDGEFRHVGKLFRLLVEAAGPDCDRFINHEVNRTLKLF